MTENRVLAVRQPWASLIVEGLKTIEVRSRKANITERVAIYASQKIAPIEDCKTVESVIWDRSRKREAIPPKYFNHFIYDTFPRGQIIGAVEIRSCEKLGIADFSNEEAGRIFSLAPRIIRGESYFWHLSDPVKFDNPIPIKWPSGGSWARIPKSMLKEAMI